MSDPLRVRIRAIDLFERPVKLRMPFRFGVVTLTETPQAFVRVTVELPSGTVSTGAAAELMVPKWFDKDPALSNEQNVDQLRRSLAIARDLSLGGPALSAFGHFAERHPEQVATAAAEGLNPLVAAFGPALIDRAVLDAIGRGTGMSFQRLVRSNAVGLAADARIAPDLAGFDLGGFLDGLGWSDRIAARHTVGLVDPLTAADLAGRERPADGLPATLEEIIATYGHRWFKLKVSGDLEADVARLAAIAAVLSRIPDGYRATLDGNEQYGSAEAVLELWRRIRAEPSLGRLAAAVAYIEQPIARARTFEEPVDALAAERPVIIDEADADLDAFPKARRLGYAGVSSKTCKGIYRSLVNAARAALWNAQGGGASYFLSGEDLTGQAGLAVQQDLALVSLLGLGHVERNGHHYVDGFAGAPPAEQAAFLAGHPDLYHLQDGRVRLAIRGGDLAIGSLDVPGFASAALPDFGAMEEMAGR